MKSSTILIFIIILYGCAFPQNQNIATPPVTTNLLAWYSANVDTNLKDTGSGSISDGEDIGTWEVSNVYDARLDADNSNCTNCVRNPVYRLSQGPNSKATIELDSSAFSTAVSYKSDWTSMDDDTITIIALCKHTGGEDVTDLRQTLFSNTNSATQDGILFFITTDSVNAEFRMYNGSGSNQIIATTDTDNYGTNTWLIIAITYSYNQSGDDIIIYKNNVDDYSDESSGAPSGAEPTYGMGIGRSPSSVDKFWFGNVCELLFYDRELNGTELTQMYNWIMNYYFPSGSIVRRRGVRRSIAQ